MLTLTADQLRAVLLARGDDPRPFTKALWVTDTHVMCTNGHRMHLLWHGQEWGHGNVAIPLPVAQAALDSGERRLCIDLRRIEPAIPTLASTPVAPSQKFWPFLPVMGATLPNIERYLPQLPTVPLSGVLRCSIDGKYLQDAQQAIALMIEEGQDDCLHRTNENTWTWCNGKFLVCVAALKNDGHKYQLKGFE